MFDWIKHLLGSGKGKGGDPASEQALSMLEEIQIDRLATAYMKGALDLESVGHQMPDDPKYWRYFWQSVDVASRNDHSDRYA